jgi:hypothetical protein
MDAKTLEALNASIAKWERNAEAKSPEDAKLGSEYCPLCHLFANGSEKSPCEGCPVKLKTGLGGCEETPYWAADWAHDDWLDGDATAEDFHAAARKEVDFLKSLLPTSEPS